MISEFNTCTIPERRTMVECKAASAVKRCLFGEPNHAHVRSELVKQLTMIIQQDSEKYNFDFVNGEPLKGKFQWEKLSETSNLQTQTEDNVKTATSEVPDALERLQLTTKLETSTTAEKKRKQTCITKPKATRFKTKPQQGKQLKLTGLFPQKKRSSIAGDPVKGGLKRHLSESAIQEKVVTTKRSCCRPC